MTDGQLLLWAGLLALAVGLVHSVLGEILIFNRMRYGTLIPTKGGELLGERHVRILWASWHVVTVFGFALAAVLLRLWQVPSLDLRPFLIGTISSAMAFAALLVLVATKGRHPGWLGLLGIAVMTWFSTG